ncbi:hypothetical protein DQG23_10475 [Paenibacillus contaminans]|uniref:DUF4838 domain-containing protein n=1 Tax=Paenibacillus contaminans TaxID=450362 RepID=A0A329MQF7_9BACL|nr:hypothetical protein DQG23_10475 [Paenibacillus contaminans]
MSLKSKHALQIVAGGQPAAIIMISSNADEQTRNSAIKLAAYVKKSTAAELTIWTEDAAAAHCQSLAGKVQIYIGAEGLPAGEPDPLEGMDGDGFVIHQDGERRRLTIAGPTSWGTEFGVNEFLERYAGVRWLAPGEDWEDVPEQKELSVPLNDQVRQEPAFFSREFDVHTSNSPEREAWTRNNRMHGRVEFKHHLFNLFPPGKYKFTHPQYYPSGADLNDIHGWQPCFSAPGIVEEAVANIIAYFDAHPEATSYSLGMNDGRNFCEADPRHPNYPNQDNSIGYPHMSDIYYDWVRQVSEGVFAKHPDKFLGTLSYLNLYDPPANVKLDPRVIVFVTDERLSWGDSELRDAGHALTSRWLQAAPGTAFYEYSFGTPYLLPRAHFNLMAESYKYAKAAGVAAHYAELTPNFGEGPRPWLSTRLQWNPDQDVELLLKDWYERAVGVDAAADLAAYYELWRDFWENRIFRTRWYSEWAYSNPRINYMNFLDDSYLEAVTSADIAQSRILLEAVVNKAATAKQKKRAADLLRAFEYYEASVLSYPEEKIVPHPVNETEAGTLVQSVVLKMKYAEKRRALVEQFAGDIVLRHNFSPYYGYGQTLGGYGRIWTGMTSGELDAIVSWLEQEGSGGAVHSLLQQLADDGAVFAIQNSVRLALSLSQAKENMSHESAEAIPEGADLWDFWLADGIAMHRSDEAARRGSYSVVAKGVKQGGMYQSLAAQPGVYGMYAAYYTPPGQSGKGTIRLQFELYDSQGNEIEVIKPYLGEKHAAQTAGRWSNIHWAGELSEGVESVTVKIILEKFEDEQEIHLDDAAFYQLDR